MTDPIAARTAAQTTALTLMAQYGDDAEVIAVLRAAELAAFGDVEALAHWDAVINLISELTTGTATPSSLN